MLRALIADDEELARRRLATLLEECGVAIVGEAGNGDEAVELAQSLKPDVVFLDIRMPGRDGLDAAQVLKQLNEPPQLIFCTAYDAHAVQAFELRAVDYLVKPIRRERLSEALKHLTPKARPARAQLAATMGGVLKRMPIAEVLFLRSDEKYVLAQAANAHLLLEESLKSLEDEFGERFVRIHRSVLVARDAVSELKRRADGETVVKLRGYAGELDVSRRNLALVRARLKRE
jgi:two-component system, LytTR family, response regulator AlgR